VDYPKSVPSAGLVNGRFVDENPVTGTPGSLIPASWGNAVTQEVLNVIQAAGIVPTEGLNTQLLAALRGNGLFETASQFDSSRMLATTEFVQRAIGSCAGETSYTGDVVLTGADVGRLSVVNAAATATLPEYSTVPAGSIITITSSWLAPGNFSVKAKNGEKLSAYNGDNGPFSFASGAVAVFRRLRGGGWSLDSGDAALKYSPMFSSSLGVSGFQKHPSGMIEQWGSGVTDASGNAYVTFPVSFPNAVSSIVANHVGSGGAVAILAIGSDTKQGCTLKLWNMAGQFSAGWLVKYRAVGF